MAKTTLLRRKFIANMFFFLSFASRRALRPTRNLVKEQNNNQSMEGNLSNINTLYKESYGKGRGGRHSGFSEGCIKLLVTSTQLVSRESGTTEGIVVYPKPLFFRCV